MHVFRSKLEKAGGRSEGEGERVERRERGVGDSKQHDEVHINWTWLRSALLRDLGIPAGQGAAKSPLPPVAERSVESTSLPDLVQEVLADIYEHWSEGGIVPRTLETLKETARREVLHRWHSRWRLAAERAKNLERHGLNLTPLDQFDVICAHDEHLKFATLLLKHFENEPDAKRLLILVYAGVPFSDTKELSLLIPGTMSSVTNMKRRILRRALKITADLSILAG